MPSAGVRNLGAALPLLPALALCGVVLLRRKGRKTL